MMAWERKGSMEVDLRERFVGLPSIGTALEHLYAFRDEAMAVDVAEHPDAQPVRDRILGLVVHIEGALSTVEPLLMTDSIPASMTTALSQLRSQLPAHLPAAPEGLEPYVAPVADIARSLVSVAGTASGPSLLDVEQRLEQAVATAKEEIEDLARRRSELVEEIDQLKETAAELVSQKSGELADLIQTGDNRITQVADAGRVAYETDRKELVKFGEATVESAEETLAELRRVLAIAGDESLSANYGKRADIEDQEAAKLRKAAVGFGIATALAALAGAAIPVLASANEWNYDTWSSLPAKFAVIAAFGAIAAYYGRQASGHRTYAQQLRNAQLELHNIGPYLAELDTDARAAVRTQLVPTFFGKAIPSVQEDAPTTAASADQLLELARLLLAK